MMNTGISLYMGITSGRLTPGLIYNEMVTTLPVEGEAVPFEDLGERPVVQGAEWGHLFHAQRQAIKGYEFRRMPHIPCPFVTRFFENLG